LDFPNLETERLRLTQLTTNDVASIFELFSDPKVIQFYDFEEFRDDLQAEIFINRMKERFEAGTGIRWGIRLKETEKFVGTCGFNSWSKNMKSGVIGYDLLPVFWGQGIMTEAVSIVLKSAFSGKLPCNMINRVEADTIPGNFGSEAVLLKLGFKEEGLRRQSGYWKNQFHDLKCFGLIKSEYVEI
jgi:ribosomal-protein-alanine N-acetyltransferase